jgi:type IV pilus assembly protein PilB
MGLKKKRLGDILIDEGFITEAELMEALEQQKQFDKRLGEVLKDIGIVTEEEIAQALNQQLGFLLLTVADKENIDDDVISLLDESYIKDNRVFPIRKEGQVLILAMENPQDIVVVDEVKEKTQLDVVPRIATPTEMDEVIESNLGQQDIDQLLDSMDDMMFEQVDDSAEEVSQGDLEEQLDDTPIIKTVNEIIATGIHYQASDIHIEPLAWGTRVRYRVDGVLHTEMKIKKKIHTLLVSRIKVMSGLDIAERRKAQDGRINVEFGRVEADLRISILPASLGENIAEKVVIRIFDKSNLNLDLGYIGFSDRNLKKFKRLIKQPNGMILLTGPTGSGKSTTLYSGLNYLNNDTENIVTIEDPVEYSIEGITQTPVTPEKDLTFARALRVFLRQDPDIIMVGEIRDKETAETAINSALTGHLVLSTLHTNSAAGAIGRMINMGVEPFLLSDAVIGVVAQRLVRTVCDKCKLETTLGDYEPYIQEYIEQYVGSDFSGYKANQGSDCDRCKGLGYKGRTAIHELLEVTPAIKEEIINKSSSGKIENIAIDEDMTVLFGDGLKKVEAGVTTVEEVMRVANVE